jgi:hypothetical protein
MLVLWFLRGHILINQTTMLKSAGSVKECNLKEPIKATLELFVEKADELAKEDFTQFIEEFGHQLSYHYTADSQQLTMTTVAPTQTMHKSFLLTYRMFVQGSEHMRFIDPNKNVSPELLDSSLSPKWLEQVQNVAQKIRVFLLEKPPERVEINLFDQQGNTRTESLTRWDILETLLYGDYSHATQRERLENWLSTPFAPMVKGFLMMEFRDILAYTLGGILHLARYARLELAL